MAHSIQAQSCEYLTCLVAQRGRQVSTWDQRPGRGSLRRIGGGRAVGAAPRTGTVQDLHGGNQQAGTAVHVREGSPSRRHGAGCGAVQALHMLHA